MPRRKVSVDTKIQVMRESLRLTNIQEVLRKHDVSERSVFNWYREVLEALPDILADERPGRKSKPKTDSAPPF